ncbi:MAG: hypothetical protein B6I28_06065 [Fusobacteriia bacterium 4572_132]|nr:MAG: hypothetical protein B6I28_06065 [Fusobacteriia bacterium 4572_132]
MSVKSKKKDAEILVIDRDKIIAEAFSFFLKGIGFTARFSLTIKDVAQKMLINNYDILIIDIYVDGAYQFLKYLEKNKTDITVIITYTYKPKELFKDLEKRGYNIFLDKPFALDRLRTIIFEILTKSDSLIIPDALEKKENLIKQDFRLLIENSELVYKSIYIKNQNELLEIVGNLNSENEKIKIFPLLNVNTLISQKCFLGIEPFEGYKSEKFNLFFFFKYILQEYKKFKIKTKFDGDSNFFWVLSSKALWKEILFLILCFCMININDFEKKLYFRFSLEGDNLLIIITSINSKINNNLDDLFYKNLQEFITFSNGEVEINSEKELVIVVPTNLK